MISLTRPSAILLALSLLLPGVAAHAQVTRIDPGERVVHDVALYSGIQYSRVPGSTFARTELYLDLLRPETEEPLPVVVFVLGSGWRPTSRERLIPQLMPFAEAGYAVASIDYRGSGIAAFPDPQKDVLAAVSYLRANAASLGLDPDRIALFGNSAGGHLAMSAALGADSEQFEDARRAGVQASVGAVIAFYPALYLDPPMGMVARHLGSDLRPVEATIPDGAEPITLLGDGDPPVLIIHGTADPVVPLASSERFYEEASAMGQEPELLVVEGIGHNFADMMSVPEVQQSMIRFLDRNIK